MSAAAPTSGPATGLLAVGAYAPPNVVTNAHYAARLDTSDEWIVSRTGIRERRHAAAGETSSALGAHAVRDLLTRHPDALEGVSAVICATSSPDAMFPSTAALIAGEVGLRGAAAFDVSVACSGFLYALAVGHSLIAAGLAGRVLVVGTEVMSGTVDQEDRNTAILFGDGAGAAVLGPVPAGYGFQSFVLGADSSGGPHLYLRGSALRLPAGTEMGPYLTQNGREVFKFAVRTLGDSAEQAMREAGMSTAQIDWLVPHQANRRIIDAACERFGLPLERAVVNLDRYGNTSAASIPLALDEAVKAGRFKDGDQLLLAGFGGGLSWGAAALRWWGGAG
ncbi:3-oxoacyl-[acyl-carrier-protein] synthase III [Deinococcus reticulitermitis]|uniref:Beta-ketoacyl-[acyl-carrier-protein] synthase III n=1 Tax=Deinococcus reticulitermitis TaxID=856736 RepID=A0A1H6XA44_9DEIO|nr:beta-ketoacyl-ACP synthase III [Deinococcus reticulitermitis]SEJ26023.1 3-oxoacyl-[acyl-carrier-protein] synthase III [Deinococcus reticulitermitis]